MALTDSQLQDAILEILKIVGVSKLPSELEGLSAAPDKLHFLHIQKGAGDGQRIDIEQVRGYFGAYNPATNTPALSNNTGTEGTYYKVSVSGSRDFGNGIVEVAADDILEFKGGRWKVANVSETSASSTQVISLGEIGPTTPVEEAFNDTHFENPVTVQPLANGLTLVKATRDAIPTAWIFVGDSGVYDEVNTVETTDFFSISGSGGSVIQVSEVNGNILVNGTEVQVYDETILAGRVTTAETKLAGIEAGATADQTGSEIIAAIDTQLGSAEWKTQKTLEQIQDIIGAMFQAGTHTNISVVYDDAAGTLSLTGSAGGSGTSEEDIEDIVAGFAFQGSGINIVYDDLNNTLTFSLSGESFTTAYKNKLDGIEAGANNYVHPATHAPSIIAQDASNRFVTDTEKATWNAKEPAITKNTAFNKNFGTGAGEVAEGNHAHTADEITETVARKWVSVTEKNTWNNKASKRTRKEITNSTQYTVIAADFTDYELVFTADTSGAEISVIINTGVCPNLNPETGLQIVSPANNVLAFTGTATLTPASGTILKSANDGTSQAIIGVKPGTSVNSLGVFGTLQGDGTGEGGETYEVFTDSADGLVPTPGESGNTKYLRQDGTWAVPPDTGGGESYDVFTNTEDGLVPAPNVGTGEVVYTAVITSPATGFEFTEGDVVTVNATLTETVASAGKKILTSDGWEDSVPGSMEGQSLTGTEIDLSNVAGNNYNYAAFSSATTYTIASGSKVINGFARCFINAATEPTVTGATKVLGNVFEPNENMEMVVESPNGVAAEYYFRRR